MKNALIYAVLVTAIAMGQVRNNAIKAVYLALIVICGAVFVPAFINLIIAAITGAVNLSNF